MKTQNGLLGMIGLSGLLILSNTLPTLASETVTITSEQSQSITLKAEMTSEWSVTVPKEVRLQQSGERAGVFEGTLPVTVQGNIAQREEVLLTIPDTVELEDTTGMNTNTTVEITKGKTSFTATDLQGGAVVESSHSLLVELTPGVWEGTLVFDITLEHKADYASIPFSELTWKEIATLARSGEFKTYYSLGDSKTFEYQGQTFTAEVVGVDTYKDGEITFITKELLPDKYPMKEKVNDVDTYEGGWPASDLRTTLNETIYNGLPTDLKAVIKPKTLNYEITQATGGDVTFAESTSNLWIPTQYEVGASWMETQQSSAMENFCDNVSEYQHGYELFADYTDSDTRYIKYIGSKATTWWTTTPMAGSKSAIKQIDSSGIAWGNNGPSTPVGVPLCFVIY